MTAIIRPALAQDAEALGYIAPAAYAEAYADLWDDPKAYARQLATFGAAAFSALLAREDARLWVVEDDGLIFGFLTLILGSLDPINARPSGAEIPRIYILGPARRLRLGKRMLDAAIAEATRSGADYVWLDVMASADWAQRAYGKWGFREIGEQRFEKGVRAGAEGMNVLAKDLR